MTIALLHVKLSSFALFLHFCLTSQLSLLLVLLSAIIIVVFIEIEQHIFFVALRPNAGHGLLSHEVSRSHITTHQSR